MPCCFASFFILREVGEKLNESVMDALERTPIIAATDRYGWKNAVLSDAEVLFHLGADIMTVADDIAEAKVNGKFVFIHIDLTDGIGKDKSGINWLKKLGADGIVSTRTQLIRAAHDCGMLSVQRFFMLDSNGMHSVAETIENTKPDLIEIMPGVIPKALKLFSYQRTPVIAGGLIESKQEATAALSAGAVAVSSGKKELWNEI